MLKTYKKDDNTSHNSNILFFKGFSERLDSILINSLSLHKNGLVAPLNSASDYGSEGSRFESWRGHEERKAQYEMLGFFIFRALQVYFQKQMEMEKVLAKSFLSEFGTTKDHSIILEVKRKKGLH